MAKCAMCKKWGLFMSVNSEGLCKECALIRTTSKSITSNSVKTPTAPKKKGFDYIKERELISAYKSSSKNVLNQHFASISLQDFYYKYRELDDKYLNSCIQLCEEDISKLQLLQDEYYRDCKAKIMNSPLLSRKEKEKEISNIRPFNGRIPAFQRLAIIYEKNKDYSSAINVCNMAINYYASIGNDEDKNDFISRVEKIHSKQNKK